MSVRFPIVPLDDDGRSIDGLRNRVEVTNGSVNVSLVIAGTTYVMCTRDAAVLGSALLNAAMNVVEGKHGDAPDAEFDSDERATDALSDERIHR